MQRHPGHKYQAHELTTHVQCSFSTYTHLHRANHSSVILLGSASEEADLPIPVNRLTLAKHYQLSNKHVTEVSTIIWNYLIELEWLEDIVCLSRTHSSEEVSNHRKTEQIQSKTRRIERKLTLWIGGISWPVLSDLDVQQTQYQWNEIVPYRQ